MAGRGGCRPGVQAGLAGLRAAPGPSERETDKSPCCPPAVVQMGGYRGPGRPQGRPHPGWGSTGLLWVPALLRLCPLEPACPQGGTLAVTAECGCCGCGPHPTRGSSRRHGAPASARGHRGLASPPAPERRVLQTRAPEPDDKPVPAPHVQAYVCKRTRAHTHPHTRAPSAHMCLRTRTLTPAHMRVGHTHVNKLHTHLPTSLLQDLYRVPVREREGPKRRPRGCVMPRAEVGRQGTCPELPCPPTCSLHRRARASSPGTSRGTSSPGWAPARAGSLRTGPSGPTHKVHMSPDKQSPGISCLTPA